MKWNIALAAYTITPLPGLALIPASSLTAGRLSERDDVQRAVALLMGQTDKDGQAAAISSPTPLLEDDQVEASSLEAPEAEPAMSPFSAAKLLLIDKVSSPLSALDSTLEKYGKPSPRPDSHSVVEKGTLSNDLSLDLEASPDEAAEVGALLEAVSSTDRGMVCEPDQRLRVEKLIAELEARAVDQNALESEWLCQRSEVIWVGQSDSGRSNAAGGKFRGRLGRLLFQTTGLYQHLLRVADYPGPLKDDNSAASISAVAVNFLRFKLFGLLPGAVVLAGPVTPSDGDASSSGGSGSSSFRLPARNRVLARFDAPRISLGGARIALPVLRMGPTSKVHLDTTYLGPRLRISRGATSGTPFVFKHLTEPETTAEISSALDAAVAKSWAQAEMWRPLVRNGADLSAKPAGMACVLSSVAAWVAAAMVSTLRGHGLWPDWAWSCSALGLAAFGVALATSSGGIDDREGPQRNVA